MIEFLIIYISLALLYFTTAVIISAKDCREKNKGYTYKRYKVNYSNILFKSVFLPVTIFAITYEIIKNAGGDTE